VTLGDPGLGIKVGTNLPSDNCLVIQLRDRTASRFNIDTLDIRLREPAVKQEPVERIIAGIGIIMFSKVNGLSHGFFAIDPGHDWPDGKPPNKSDVASTKLAKLEIRWQGLER